MNTRHFLLFVVGVFLLTGAVIVGVGAFEYEVVSLGTVETIPEDTQDMVDYRDLSGRDRVTVGRAIAGERFVFRDPSDLPGPSKRKGKLAVNRDGETYLLTRRVFFNWRTRFGLASVSMALVGVASVFESIRREHFPHRSPVPWR